MKTLILKRTLGDILIREGKDGLPKTGRVSKRFLMEENTWRV